MQIPTNSTLRAPSWLGEDLLRVEDVLAAAAGASTHPLVSEPALHLIRAGGKRIRPALVLLAARAGSTGRRETDLAAAAIELIHLATLYHDDVIDETQMRRGVPTAHAKWGIEVAVLAGDYLFAAGCALGAEAGGEVPRILARALGRVCEGQIAETAMLNDPRRTVEEYLDTISLKTAALFQAACELGATTSGIDGEVRAKLSTYGTSLGLAFQIVDDLLDLLGDEEITGKSRGTDLKEGVFTAPVLMACERDADLIELLSAGRPDVEDVLPYLWATGALAEARSLAGAYQSAALGALEGMPDGEWRGAMAATAESVVSQVAPLFP